MKVSVVIPFGSMGCEYRERNFQHIKTWIAQFHPEWPVFIGSSDRDPFSPAQARNNGAAAAGDWDVLVFWDADTLVHPDAVREAVRRAASAKVMVLACDSHIYTDQLSADRYLATGLMFPKPRGNESQSFGLEGIYRRPCSGVLAVGRELWTATGGYIDSLGGEDSHEDLAFFQQCGIFGKGVKWVEGIQIHLWHPPAPRSNGRNYEVWKRLADMKRKGLKVPAKRYLASLGHSVP
jgi:glycosyltransferase involved in cell wall biosynthesis